MILEMRKKKENEFSKNMKEKKKKKDKKRWEKKTHQSNKCDKTKNFFAKKGTGKNIFQEIVFLTRFEFVDIGDEIADDVALRQNVHKLVLLVHDRCVEKKRGKKDLMLVKLFILVHNRCEETREEGKKKKNKEKKQELNAEVMLHVE